MADYDLIGNIAIIKGEGKTSEQKIEQAKLLLKQSNIKTVLEKFGNVHGRLRTIHTKFIAGEKNIIALHKENNSVFRFNVETCYFSPRLAEERKIVAVKIKPKHRVLVMFAGVGVYPIVTYKIAKPNEIVAVELGKECCKYFNENLKLNKIPEGKIKVIQGDVKRKINSSLGKFDVILMPRPNLKDTFFKQALEVSKKSTLIYYYGFCPDNEIEQMKQTLVDEAKEQKKKIKIIKTAMAGDIAPYKHRFRIEIKVM